MLWPVATFDPHPQGYEHKSQGMIGLIIIYIQYISAGNQCVTKSGGFKVVRLEKQVLFTALSAPNNLRGDKIEKREKQKFCHMYI